LDELTTSQKDGSGIDRYGENLTGMDKEEELEAMTRGAIDEEDEGRSDFDIAVGGEVDDEDIDAMMFVFVFPLSFYSY
jgi:hypothetical protein